MRGGVWVGVVLLTAGLAGCVGSDEANLSDAEPTGVPVDDGAGAAALFGLVTDEEFLPIERADVVLAKRSNPTIAVRQAETGPDGAYRFEGVASGSYVIQASKFGYRASSPESVELAPGQEVERNLELAPVPTVEGFHVSDNYRVGYIYYACPVVQPGDLGAICLLLVYGFDSGNRTYYYDNDEAELGTLQTFFVETRWTRSVDSCHGQMRTDVYSPEQGAIDFDTNEQENNPYHWDNVPEAADSPTRVVIPRQGEGELAILSPARTEWNGGKKVDPAGKWTIAMEPYADAGTLGTPVDYYCLLNQVVEGWITAFYNDPAPSMDWSAFEEG